MIRSRKIRSLLLSSVVALGLTVGSAEAAPASRRASTSTFGKLCRTVRTSVGSAFLYKVEASTHINRLDPRTSGPTLICNRECPSSFPASLYYSDGNLAAKLGYYGVWNVTGKARAYCAAGGVPKCSNREIQNSSRARGRDGNVYLRMGSSGVCYRIDPRQARTGTPR